MQRTIFKNILSFIIIISSLVYLIHQFFIIPDMLIKISKTMIYIHICLVLCYSVITCIMYYQVNLAYHHALFCLNMNNIEVHNSKRQSTILLALKMSTELIQLPKFSKEFIISMITNLIVLFSLFINSNYIVLTSLLLLIVLSIQMRHLMLMKSHNFSQTISDDFKIWEEKN